ncbi:TetR family transcriptional regulator [Streptomyces sp. WAC 06738]|uniref:TetR/AcrR family transcriptional regulator n=1 Tax=Streptomyces sp. WAC 06738 TaxID=2203210 RepID=UPI000F6BFE3D|nr:TetR/AcrR family transcriptional regulator [Streptomyces sp. WAC 06738]AZM50512.1 TetR family transcriptional regulator [Streptomyces sp. WAC 06738]
MGVSKQQQSRQAEVARNDAALLEAARRVFARDGARASVNAIAEAAGVGMGTLYRRYRSKHELYQRLLVLANEQWAAGVERAAAHDDPWQGLAELITDSAEYGQGTLAPLGRLAALPPAQADQAAAADRAFEALVDRAHQSGGLRGDVTATDILLLIEQLGRSPLVEQVQELGDAELTAQAQAARRRMIALALGGLAAEPRDDLPGAPPGERLLTARWRT